MVKRLTVTGGVSSTVGGGGGVYVDEECTLVLDHLIVPANELSQWWREREAGRCSSCAGGELFGPAPRATVALLQLR